MRVFGIALLIVGLTMMAWNGYQRWESMQSVTHLSDGVAKAIDNNQEPKQTPVEQQKPKQYKPKRQKHTQTDHHQKSEPNVSATKQNKNPDYQQGEEIAKLTIPAIHEAFDVFWGTDQATLAKGVGMYVSKWTVPPGGSGHTVLAGHRDSVFRPVGDLKEGESLYVTYHGTDYEYRIDKIWITDANDRTVIVKKQEPTLTLSTCYPFHYIGHAPKRYIIQSKLVKKGDLLTGTS